MADDIVMNKAAIIERCIARVKEVHAGDDARLNDLTRQDSIILNLQRACEAAIDLAMYAVRIRRLGIPQESRDAFTLLEGAGLLDRTIADRMRKMVGFRNVAVHDYTKINVDIVKEIIEKRLSEFLAFSQAMLRMLG